MTAVWDNFIGPLQLTNRYYIHKLTTIQKKEAVIDSLWTY